MQEWIKTSEKVPRSNGEYIITYVHWDSDGNGYVNCGTAEFDGGHWTIHGRIAWDVLVYEKYPVIVLKNGKTPAGTKIDVDAWMPLPEPYCREKGR